PATRIDTQILERQSLKRREIFDLSIVKGKFGEFFQTRERANVDYPISAGGCERQFLERHVFQRPQVAIQMMAPKKVQRGQRQTLQRGQVLDIRPIQT